MGNIQRLQDGIKKLWTDELYSDEFRASPSRYKDFDHALKHVRKAAQALENMTEEADHGGQPFKQADVEKYLADLVICTARLALKTPNFPIDLEKAIFERIEMKMGARIEMEAHAEEKRLNERIAALKKALWDQVQVWNDPSDRNFKLCGICGAHEFKRHQSSCVLA